MSMSIFSQEFAAKRSSAHPTSAMTILAQNIRTLLAHSRLTQAQFASKVGARQPQVSKWIGEKQEVPQTETLMALAKLAGVTVESFRNEPWSPDAEREQPFEILARVIMPSEASLRRMFEALLEEELMSEEARDELAGKLARRLPNALETALTDREVPVRGAGLVRNESTPPPATPRGPRQQKSRT